MADVVVTIPAEPIFIHLLRAVVASVGARQDFLFDAIDDLRMAVDEAAIYLLQQPKKGTQLTLTVSTSGAGIEALLESDAAPDEWPPPDARNSLSWKVLTALVKKAEFDRTGGGFPAIRFHKAPGG